MTLRNRVSPLGELIADPARGTVFGNRGCLHDDAGRIVRAFAVRRWISCRLEFKGRRRELVRPGHYTELFFLDEATALAAGHRPCAECRRADHLAFRAGRWDRADAIDDTLHAERGEHHHEAFGELPDGVFVLRDGAPWLVHGERLLRWTAGGYTDAVARPSGRAVVVTPPSTVAVLRGGWRPDAVPLVHDSARLR